MPPHVDMGNAILVVNVTDGREAETRVEVAQMRLGGKVNVRVRMGAGTLGNAEVQKCCAESRATPGGGGDDATEMTAAIACWRGKRGKQPQVRGEGAAFGLLDKKVECLRIPAVDLGVGTFLFHHKDIDPQPQKGVKAVHAKVGEVAPEGAQGRSSGAGGRCWIDLTKHYSPAVSLPAPD